jgi:hypothetical protein
VKSRTVSFFVLPPPERFGHAVVGDPFAQDALGRQFLHGQRGGDTPAVGSLGEESRRDVNDRDFDVTLHLVFKNGSSASFVG